MVYPTSSILAPGYIFPSASTIELALILGTTVPLVAQRTRTRTVDGSVEDDELGTKLQPVAVPVYEKS